MGGDVLLTASTSSPTTSFLSKRINKSTFLVIEDDVYGEQPYIYVKIYPDYILVTDTGCNSPRNPCLIASLRTYLETSKLQVNEGQALNPNGEKKYVIICSHCHYDHILGLPSFASANPTVIASGFDRDFLLNDLPTHSLCRFVNVATPKYHISHWAAHMEYFAVEGVPLRIQFLHVPGHTPDSLAWYDLDEQHLYVGDTFYERRREVSIPHLPEGLGDAPDPPLSQGAIIFPSEGGNWIQYMSSLSLLLDFVLFQNSELKAHHISSDIIPPRVRVGCGHLTHSADAEEMIREVKALFERIITGKVPVTGSTHSRDAIYDFWLESEDARYSVKAPRRIVEKAREHFSCVNLG
jgi:glyoxylase-like metal-dependent hydrolase (beta-lactamase superfamily II)